MALLSALTFVREIRRPAPMPDWSNALLGTVAPLRSVSGYGLFRVMTTERPEIVIEGSADGETWLEYPFPWKAGEPARAPGFVQPHMPRLDWQMWFAALDPQRQAHWLFALVDRLLENDPTALGLLDSNPFPHEPPRLHPPRAVPLSVHDARGRSGRGLVDARADRLSHRADSPALIGRNRRDCRTDEPGSPRASPARCTLWTRNFCRCRPTNRSRRAPSPAQCTLWTRNFCRDAMSTRARRA